MMTVARVIAVTLLSCAAAVLLSTVVGVIQYGVAPIAGYWASVGFELGQHPAVQALDHAIDASLNLRWIAVSLGVVLLVGKGLEARQSRTKPRRNVVPRAAISSQAARVGKRRTPQAA